MLLSHARDRAFSHIYQSSAPLVMYIKDKTVVVPNEDAEDWEPMPFIPEQTVAASFREDGKTIIEEEPDV